MININTVTLMGKIGSPDFSHTPNGTPVCKFIVMTETNKRGRKVPTFHNVSVIGQTLCDIVLRYSISGQTVLVRGSLEYWNSENTRMVDIKADYIEFNS